MFSLPSQIPGTQKITSKIQFVFKICDMVAVTGNKYLYHIGLAEWPWAELNNTVHSLYICPAVCIVCCTTIWRQPGLSRGFVDYFVILLNC